MVRQAIASYGEGKTRTVARVFARIDVVLLAYRHTTPDESTTGKASDALRDIQFIAMINEVMPSLNISLLPRGTLSCHFTDSLPNPLYPTNVKFRTGRLLA